MPTPRRPRPPRPTLALFVRHGRTPTTGDVLPGLAPGLHLDDTGRAQAEALADRIDTLSRVDAVYASPLERARETAAPLARRAGLRVRVERGLRECDFGDWTGASLKTLRKQAAWRTVQRCPSGFRFPNGESFTEMQTRMTTTVARLSARHEGGTIVLVSHADPIKAAVADALGVHLDLFQRIVVSPCSVTAVVYDTEGPTVLTVNALDDLRELNPR